MRGAVLYGPRDVRFEDRETPKIDRADRRCDPHGRDVRLRIGPLAVSGPATDRRSDADGARVLRHSSKRSAAR